LREGNLLPESYKSRIFDTKKEYELIYAKKTREEDILADTMAVPLQKVKTFYKEKGTEGWSNMLIFGDNLQVLKSLLKMKHEGKLKTATGLPGVKLIYIDPPFATQQEFKGSQEEKAYQDKIAGARFLEFLRKRLVFLHELLSEDGSIFVHMDYRAGHSIKILLDEIFQPENFRNEISARRKIKNLQNQFDKVRRLNIAFDSIFWYSKNSSTRFEIARRDVESRDKEEDQWNNFFNNADRPTLRYQLLGIELTHGQWRWKPKTAYASVKNYKEYLEKWSDQMSLYEYWVMTGKKKRFIKRDPGSTRCYYWVAPKNKRPVDSNWFDIYAYDNSPGAYPTQKSEWLLKRIVEAFADDGDIVLDAFAGSGTTLAVAEKLNRRWIGIDCGKLAIYTMQKRLLGIAKSVSLRNPPKKYRKRSNPFTLFNAGLYDYGMIKELDWERYRVFSLELFQCREERHHISKIELDGYLGADSVMVFNYQKHANAVMDRGFIDDLHKYIGDKVGNRFFIIAPAASVTFLEDYIEKGNTKYFVLRIPYSIIEEIHDNRFKKLKQPINEIEVNDTIDAVGFDFIQVPTVKCVYLVEQKKGQQNLAEKEECVIRIESFESKAISKKPLKFSNLETLSMVMIDYNFNGKVFNLEKIFYNEEIRKNNNEIRFSKDKIKDQIMIIYIDIFGNEKREVKNISHFSREH